MKGIIIAGGFGTRLIPLTKNRPKHLLPVANRPFLEYQVALLRRHGIDEVVFATNYLADQIEGHFGDGSTFGVRMRYALEEDPLGTAGAIRNAAALVPGETLLVFNGDVLTDFDLSAIVAFHRDRGAAATIALRPVERPHPFGALTVEAEGRITAWSEPTEAEKKRIAEFSGTATGVVDFINAGIYIIEPEIVERIPAGRPVSIERETYPMLLGEGSPIYGTALAGYWMDIGRPEQYLAANSAVLTGAVDTDVPFRQIAESAEMHSSADMDATTAVGDRVRVGQDARISGSIILSGTTIGRGARLAQVIADENVAIGNDVSVRPGAVLAAGSVLTDGTRT